MSNRINFTMDGLDKLTASDESKRAYFYDTKVPGLTVQVTPNGVKTFQVYKRHFEAGRWTTFRKSLGRFPDLALDDARKLAKRMIADLAHGDDPRVVEREAELNRLTMGELFNQYIDEYAKHHTRTWQDTRDNYRRYFKRWDSAPVITITKKEIQAWVYELGEKSGKHTANRSYDTMRAVITWGMNQDRISLASNPCIGIERFETKARERFLLPGDEYRRFEEAVNSEKNETIRDFVWMALYTAMRSANVRSMRWADIDWDLQVWRIPGVQFKNGDSQTVNLVPAALNILSSRHANKLDDEWVFPGDGRTGHLVEPKKAWKKILERAGLTNLRIHDLRRTAGSYMAIQGVSPTIIGKALGHRSPQATAIYARLTDAPVRAALENAHSALGDPSKLLKQDNNIVHLPKVKTG